MNTRRAFLAEAGVALSGLLLPGITRACCRRRRRCRSGRCTCPSPCPGACVPATTPYAIMCQSGCPYSLTGQWNGVYHYSCRCYPSCNTFIDVASAQFYSPLPRPCDGSSANCISLPAAFESLGPTTGFYASTQTLAGLKNYVTLKDEFIVPKGSGIVAKPHGSAQYLDHTQKPPKTRYVRLYVVRRPDLPTLRVGQELADETTDPKMHDKKAKLIRAIEHYHQISSGGQTFHVLTKK